MLVDKLKDKLIYCIDQDIPFGVNYCVLLSIKYKKLLQEESFKIINTVPNQLFGTDNDSYSLMGNNFLLIYKDTDNTDDITIFKQIK